LVFFICACLCFISTMRNIEAKNVVIKFILNKEHVLVMLLKITFLQIKSVNPSELTYVYLFILFRLCHA
jgi:hypothetical protein